MSKKEKKHLFDNPRNVKIVIYALFIACGLLPFVDLLIHKHAYFGFDGWFGFYAWFGFVACVILVITAKGLRVLLKRPEDYYDQ